MTVEASGGQEWEQFQIAQLNWTEQQDKITHSSCFSVST
jgi:hypothetical protein